MVKNGPWEDLRARYRTSRTIIIAPMRQPGVSDCDRELYDSWGDCEMPYFKSDFERQIGESRECRSRRLAKTLIEQLPNAV